VDILLVSHFHWDREWYRTFDEFRARLVDAIDRVLDLIDDDPGFCFLLDGQTIVLDDYLAVRPANRDRIVAGVQAGRLGIGPWYVQPDSFLPSGEAHVRNLLLGRALAAQFGAPSRVAYVPDSFGHPAQFPQLFAGFGLDPFVYWRGNGSEIDALAPCYAWRAPDGSMLRAFYLAEGYFGAGGLDADGDVAATVARLKPVVDKLAGNGTGPVLLMNGFDHLPPDTTTAAVADAIGARRVLLDALPATLPSVDALEVFEGALDGARIANLLPGVWSSRMPLKLRNRAIETLLGAWTEPWAAFGALHGLADERPALDTAWQLLVQNQAHDSIGGCSVDGVHARMEARYDDAEGLGRATLTRTLERLAGRNVVRDTPWNEAQELVVFNASPIPRTDIVRVPLEGFPPWRVSVTRFDFHPLSMPSFAGGTIDGEPVRIVPSDDPQRVRFIDGGGGLDAEFVARDVPAFGCRRFRFEPTSVAAPDTVDDGLVLEAAAVRVEAEPDGTLAITLGDRTFRGLFDVEDCIVRGDAYDADTDPPRLVRGALRVARSQHPSGVGRLRVTRALDDIGDLVVEAVVAPGVPFVRCAVALDNRAGDHRLRLRFPSGSPVDAYTAATTFDTATRSTAPAADADWTHPAPRTFVQQGWVSANGLVVGAPGLPEAEVTPDGDIVVTLVRSVGALARIEVRTRPMPAGPEMMAPGAQTLGTVRATVTIAASAADARAAEVGFVGVLGDEDVRLADGVSLLTVEGGHALLSACKPAVDGDGMIVRVLNPSADPDDVTLRFGFDLAGATAVRLDESPVDDDVARVGRTVSFTVRPHALRSVRIQALRR
jgi:hypothetical protein